MLNYCVELLLALLHRHSLFELLRPFHFANDLHHAQLSAERFSTAPRHMTTTAQLLARLTARFLASATALHLCTEHSIAYETELDNHQANAHVELRDCSPERF